MSIDGPAGAIELLVEDPGSASDGPDGLRLGQLDAVLGGLDGRARDLGRQVKTRRVVLVRVHAASLPAHGQVTGR